MELKREKNLPTKQSSGISTGVVGRERKNLLCGDFQQPFIDPLRGINWRFHLFLAIRVDRGEEH